MCNLGTTGKNVPGKDEVNIFKHALNANLLPFDEENILSNVLDSVL